MRAFGDKPLIERQARGGLKGGLRLVAVVTQREGARLGSAISVFADAKAALEQNAKRRARNHDGRSQLSCALAPQISRDHRRIISHFARHTFGNFFAVIQHRDAVT